MIEIKIFLTIVATVIGIIAFFPYFKDILLGKTKPHAYTWLIWTLTQGTAVFAIWKGGGGLGGLNLTIGLFFVFGVFLFSLKYGTKDITKEDKIILSIAILAILIWWQLNQPVISVIMVSMIDLFGCIPSIRKSYKDPWSETLSTWALFIISNLFAIMALEEYNLLTLTYIITITLANLSILVICLIRRKWIKKINSKKNFIPNSK